MKEVDPSGFEVQEQRRARYLQLKRAGRAGAFMAATLRPRGHLDEKVFEKEFPDASATCDNGDGLHGMVQSAAAVGESVLPSSGGTGAVPGDEARVEETFTVKEGSTAELLRDAKLRMASGEFTTLLIELCCERGSMLTACTPAGSLALRITEAEDLSSPSTKRAIHSIIRFAGLMSINVHVWTAILCTAGCKFKAINDSLCRKLVT